MIIGDAGYKQNLNIKVINFEDTSKQTCIYRSSEATLYVFVSVCQSIFCYYSFYYVLIFLIIALSVSLCFNYVPHQIKVQTSKDIF